MQNFRISLIIFLLIFGFTLTAKSQPQTTFTSLSGGFAVDLPDKINGGGSNGTAGGVYMEWRQPEAGYKIGFYEIEGLPSAKVNGVFSFDQMVRKYFNEFSADGEKIYDKEISLQNAEGREYKYQTATAVHLLRLYKDGSRLYEVSAEIPVNKQSGEAKVLRVFDSFRILDKEKISAAIAKKTADATPKALPQTPVVAKLKSDIQDANLKGKVKSVLTEIASYALQDSLREKKRRIVEEFNESGNLLKKIKYNSEGNPSQIYVYGYLAGKRVSRFGSVSYGNEPPGIALEEAFTAKADKRFDESYTYRYLGGKLVDERVFFSNGVLQSRSAIRYLQNRKEQSFYDDRRKPFRIVVYTLDDKGNETEITTTNTGGMYPGESKKYKVEYESFDEKGNWTKRVVSEWYGFQNQGRYSPEYVEFRTVTYYQ